MFGLDLVLTQVQGSRNQCQCTYRQQWRDDSCKLQGRIVSAHRREAAMEKFWSRKKWPWSRGVVVGEGWPKS